MRARMLLVATMMLVAGCEPTMGSRPADDRPPRLLVFSRTTGFRHASIPAAQAAIAAIASARGLAVEWTEDPTWFTDATLARFDAVVFLLTTGDVLDDAGQQAFERFVRAGGGFVGVHSASDTEYDWPWYGELVGAYFASHPPVQSATVDVANAHPSLLGLPARFGRTDEWYDFASAPIATATVLLTVDESSYTGGVTGSPHPIAWAHEYDGGRAWYTAMGHTEASYAEPIFVTHLIGGILWALGQR